MNLINKQFNVNQTLKTMKHNGLNYLSYFNQLNQNNKNLINRWAFFNNVMDDVKTKQRHDLINIEREFNNFLLNKKQETKNNYRSAYNTLLEFKGNNDLLSINRAEAERFLHYLINTKKLANNSVRTRIIALKSFYEYLATIYKGISNPWRYLKIPRMVKKHEGTSHFLTKADILTINDALLDLKTDTLLKAVYLCLAHGLRWAECSNIKGNKNELVWIAKRSKLRSVKPTRADIEMFKLTDNNMKQLIPSFKSYVYQRNKLTRIISKLDLSYKPTPHDFRHYFAIQLYKKTKDVLLVSQALGHSNIATTDIYLQSLKGSL